MFTTTPMSDTFELPEGLKDFPKVVSIQIDKAHNDTPSVSDYGGQDYYHWSILDNYVHRDRCDVVTDTLVVLLSKLLIKANEGASILDLQDNIKKCMRTVLEI